MGKRMTTKQLEEIRNRAEVAGRNKLEDDDIFVARSKLAIEDVPAILASVEQLLKENSAYRGALSQIAHGDTWTAYPHDIAAWALGLGKGIGTDDNE